MGFQLLALEKGSIVGIVVAVGGELVAFIARKLHILVSYFAPLLAYAVINGVKARGEKGNYSTQRIKFDSNRCGEFFVT